MAPRVIQRLRSREAGPARASWRSKATGQWVLARSVHYAMRTKRFLSNRVNNLGELISGFAISLLNQEGIAHLNRAIYGSGKAARSETLFPWEEEWFEHDLPRPPARLLVGGAGTGREVKVLTGMGYEVVAFEPAEQCVNRARQEITEEGCLAFLVGSYEDLAPQGAGENGTASVVGAYAPYDAVLLGWGSFTHLRGKETRLALLDALHRLCPEGPVLLSFWLQESPGNARRNRAFTLGYRIGRFFNRRSIEELPPAGDEITPHAGYGHFFTMQEIEELIETSHYQLAENPRVSYLKSYPHITIKPMSPPR